MPGPMRHDPDIVPLMDLALPCMSISMSISKVSTLISLQGSLESLLESLLHYIFEKPVQPL